MASLDVDAYSLNGVNTIEAEYWITNARAKDDNGSWKLSIDKDTVGEDGKSVAELAPPTRTDIIGYETTVFGHARVLGNRQRQEEYRTDRSTYGTEIDAIRYHGKYVKHFQYREKGGTSWQNFPSLSQLVFYYLVRTDYSKMVQIDVSDWAYDDLSNEVDDTYRNNPEHRSVTYQVYVKNADGSYTLTDDRKFWYSKTFTVSSVLVRQTDADHYTIDSVALDPFNLGNPTVNDNDEYQFSLDLSETEDRNATVKIYVTPKVQPHKLKYVLNGGAITSAEGTYSRGLVLPDATITTPTAKKDNCTFDGWYDETGKKYETGATMPDNDLTLYAKFTAKETPNPEPEPDPTPAKYFVLLPTRDAPKNNDDQGEEFYLPSSKSNGGVDGLDQSTGYVGSLTQKGANAVSNAYDSVTDIVNGFSDEYLNVPSDLGFFTPGNWNEDGTYNGTADTSILGDNFNVNGIDIVWYTIKYQGEADGYHVDGYVAGVPVTVTYHPNYGTIPGMSADDHVVHATSGENHTVLDNMFTVPNGYTFGGWYTDAACTEGKKVAVDSTETLRTDWHLYAKWVKNVFDVSYFVDGSVYKIDGKEQISSHVNGEKVTLLDKPTKTGYTFDGWKHNYATSIVNVVDGKFTMPAQDVCFNGTFEINKYNVTYKVDGVETKSTKHAFNTSVKIEAEPTKEGYTFSGWKIGNADAENFKMPAHDVVIEGTYAKNSSGGSSGRSGGSHRKPTVTIQDEVPTGLNGDDHYAYIVGYPDKTVRPQNGITRAEVATIFFRLLTDETRNANSTKSNSYSDVAAGAWYNHAVSTLSAMDIVKGDSNGKFNPNASITRAEFAAIAARFDDNANTSAASFSDIANHWAKDEISAAANNGWITGYTDGTFRPNNRITRAEAMALVNRVLKRLPETDEDLHADMIKWSDNSDASQWYYLDVQEATHSHYYQTKENQFEKWTELRDTRDWTELEK